MRSREQERQAELEVEHAQRAGVRMMAALGLSMCDDCGAELLPRNEPHKPGCEEALREAHEQLQAECHAALEAIRAEYRAKWVARKAELGGGR